MVNHRGSIAGADGPTPMLIGALVLLLVGCASRAPVPASGDPSDDGWQQYASAGWLGCQPERVEVSDSRALDQPGGGVAWTWLAECEGTAMVCSGSDEVRCSALRPSGAERELAATESPVTRQLPPELIACTERPVAVEGLFDGDGRLQDLRPWPGETPEQRACVVEALEQMDVPEWHGALIRFVPRDPWSEAAEP